MNNCIFCKIVNKEIPAEIVYEDDRVLGFLDIRPVNFGHTLLIPKEHYVMIDDFPDEMIGPFFAKAKYLIRTIRKAVNADFVALSVVGVDVPHFHIHIIPRFYNDGLANFWPSQEYKEGEMKETGRKIRSSF